MIRLVCYILLILLACCLDVSGQDSDSGALRQRSFYADACMIELDTFTIAPRTVSIATDEGVIVDGYSTQNRSLVFSDSLCSVLSGQLVRVSYRVLPFDIERSYFHLDSTMMKFEDQAIYIDSDYTSNRKKGQEIIDAKGLDYNGSFSRGFSVGNSQSLVLNSNFNLQLAGDLGNRMKVVAAISDDNIPIQPEGNTQLIQEFDRVFIKVSRDQSSIIAGDYNLERPKSRFINYYKKLKGLSAANIVEFGNDRQLESNASFAVARSKFARQFLDTKEGNQGPYKLVGNDGERFLIVMSGTEKVYLDGILLERGLDYDYVIDYNRAEVTFTPNRLIGRESRIIIEYEYRVQNYLRSVYAANAYFSAPKYDLNFNFYNEQDSKTATGDLVLDSTDIRLLRLAGDSLELARVSSIRPVSDTLSVSGQIKYIQNTNVMDGDPSPFFLEYSTDQNAALVVATFSEVGEGKGRYEIDGNSIVNGRVYKYVGPGNGQYDPISALVPPEKKQIISLGGKLRPRRNIDIGSEISISNTDINRFAEVGNEDNVGLAAMVSYDHNITLSKKSRTSIYTKSYYEFVDQNYAPLNPYRAAEFNRDWNLSSQSIDGRQHLIQSQVGLAVADSVAISYTVKSFSIDNVGDPSSNYQGLNQRAGLQYQYRDLNVVGNLDYLQSEGFAERTTFVRPKVEVSQIISDRSTIKLGGIYEGENNQRSLLTGGNDLLSSSFSFDSYRAYLQNAESKKFHFRLLYNHRLDYFPEAEFLQKSIITDELTTATKWTISPRHALSFNFGVRDFQVVRDELLPQSNSSKRTLIGRFDHNLQAMDGMVISSTNYLINSGQEPKVEFFYERVEPGQGNYIYVGNPDSTLVSTNFRYAPDLGTAEYIRLSLINNEFITTNNQSLTQSLRIDPKKFFSARTKRRNTAAKEEKTKAVIKLGTIEKLLSRLSTVSTFRISKKVEDDGTSQQSAFLNFSPNDSSLVSYSSLISNTLFVNKGNPSFDFQIGNKRTESVFTQISGRESRGVIENFWRSRVKLGRTTDGILNLKNGQQTYNVIIDPSRSLDIRYYSINPEISYRPSGALRINMQYTYDKRSQMVEMMEEATSQDFTTAITYRQASNANLNLSLSYVSVKTNVAPNSPIEFDLLDGLKAGKNYIWNTLFTKRLSNNIDLNITYEGRKSGEAPIVHIARAQVKATF